MKNTEFRLLNQLVEIVQSQPAEDAFDLAYIEAQARSKGFVGLANAAGYLSSAFIRIDEIRLENQTKKAGGK